MKQVLRSDTLRRQLVIWLAAPLGVLWSISTFVDYDIANQFVTSAYDRSLLDSAIDIGKQIKVREGRIQADLPEVVLEMLVTGEPGKFFYLITGPQVVESQSAAWFETSWISGCFDRTLLMPCIW